MEGPVFEAAIACADLYPSIVVGSRYVNLLLVEHGRM